MKFTNFCGIFATIFVTTTIILLASCSQDDETYDSDMYTLAEEMGTRSGGNGGDPGGSGTGQNDKEYDCGYWVFIQLGADMNLVDSILGLIGWQGGGMHTSHIYTIGHDLFGFHANLQGGTAKDTLFLFRDHRDRRPQNVLVYTNDHISVVTGYEFREILTLNPDGAGSVPYNEVFGVMY